MKRVISLLVSFAVALSVTTIPALAETEYFHNPQTTAETNVSWVNVNILELGINYSGSVATCTGAIIGKSDVTSITATFSLKRVNSNGTLTTVKTWSASSNNNYLASYDNYSTVSSGETYRLEVTAVAKTATNSETVSDSMQKTY